MSIQSIMEYSKVKQFYASIICQLSVAVASAAYSWFEPIILRLTHDPQLNFTPEDISWLISIVQFGCVVAPLVSGHLTNRLGRKYVIMSIGPLCLAGWILVLFFKTMLSLIVVRILHGLATGLAFTIPPIYIAEIAEPKLRGTLSGIFQITWYLGILYSFCLGPYLSYDDFIYACLPIPIIFTILWMFMPESPYYLLINGQENDARTALAFFRNGDVVEELEEMKNAVGQEISTEGSWKTLFTDKVERKAFIIVLIVCITKYLSGLSVIVNYALDTFTRSESFLPAEEMSILLAVLLTCIAVFSAFMSDWIGRRPLLLLSCFGCFIAHFLTAAYYYIHENTTIDSSNYTWALYIGLAMYCFFSDIGLGPLLQTLQSEMFSASTRGVAAGFIQGLAGCFSFVVLKAYTPVNELYGIYINFCVYSVVALLGGVLLFCLLYETAGKTIGQMVDKGRNNVHA